MVVLQNSWKITLGSHKPVQTSPAVLLGDKNVCLTLLSLLYRKHNLVQSICFVQWKSSICLSILRLLPWNRFPEVNCNGKFACNPETRRTIEQFRFRFLNYRIKWHTRVCKGQENFKRFMYIHLFNPHD